MNPLTSEDAKRQYWKKNLKCLGLLLLVWFLASYGCGVLFVDYLDRFKLPGTNLKLGFWFAQQGSVYVFVLLIAVYARVMNRLAPALPLEIAEMVERIRLPRAAFGEEDSGPTHH